MRLEKYFSATLFIAVAAALLVHGIQRAHADVNVTSNPLQEARLPTLYWEQGLETAAPLRKAGMTQIAVTPARVAEWRKAGFNVLAISQQDLARREKLLVPRVGGRANVASATRRPWIDANGWRFLRRPSGKFVYELSAKGAGQAVLAIAEAFAYQADAVLKIDPSDLEAAGKTLTFLRALPAASLPIIADIGLIDDGTPTTGEVMNLLIRRNLLFRIVPAPSPQLRVNIKLGSKDYPRSEASDPNEFVLKVRRQLGDENRSLRIYGTEVVIGRMTGDISRSQLQVLNYSGREVDGLRVRVNGKFASAELKAFGVDRAGVEEFVVTDGATEFTIPRLGVYAWIDLKVR